MLTQANSRKAAFPVDDMFLDRWSPRSFQEKPVEREKLNSLFEAARWTPSCYNDQPWLFLYARTREDLEKFRSVLMDGNRTWADNAPVLAFVLTRKHFTHNGKPNAWAEFDAGAAWMSLAFQARKLDLYTHGMAGFKKDEAYEVLNVPKDKYTILAAIAIGYKDDPEKLPADYKEREAPNSRKDHKEVAQEGVFKG